MVIRIQILELTDFFSIELYFIATFKQSCFENVLRRIKKNCNYYEFKGVKYILLDVFIIIISQVPKTYLFFLY